jgi:hypothetical protein
VLTRVHHALKPAGTLLVAELPELLEGAGFVNVRVADQPLPTRFVMLADKPPLAGGG